MINKQRLVKRFIKYVKIPSLSRQEKHFGEVVRKELRALGIRSRLDEAGNIYAEMKGSVKNAPCLLINAHLDTVGPGENIKPRIRYGVIETDGTTVLGADNKAGVAAILEVLQVLKKENIPHGDLLIIFTVQEEIGLLGARELRKSWLKADLGYVLDGGDVASLLYQAPAQYNLKAEIFGKAAHAGVHPEDGINAIQVASEAIARMRLGRIDHETTANIGIISGGTATNIIPEKVEIKGEARSHNRKKLKSQLKHMQKCLYRACSKYRASIKINVDNVYNSFSLKKTDKVVKAALSALARLELKPIFKKTGGGSDANIFNELGIKSLIIGVGAHRVHTKGERLPIDEFVNGARLLLEIIKENCAGKDIKK